MANKSTNSKKSVSAKNTVKKAPVKKAATKKVEPKKSTTTPIKKVDVKTKEIKKIEVKEEPKKIEIKKIKVNKKENLIKILKKNFKSIGLGFIALLLVINVILVLTGNEVKLKDGKEVIASLDGEEITAEELFKDLKNKFGNDTLINIVDNFIASKELKDNSKAKELAQQQLDGIKKQYEDAGQNWEDVLKQYGYSNEDTLLQEFVVASKKELIAKNYIEKSLTDDEINKYYEEEIYGTYTVKHILVKPATTDSMTDEEKASAEEAAKTKANEVITKLNEGADWATLVKEYSEDEGSKDNEGLVENFTKGDMVDEFFNATLNLKDGKYSTEPVKSEYGYHVILKVSSTKKPSLKDKKDDIINTLIENKLSADAKLYTTTWVSIRKKYNLNIKDTSIKNAYEKSING